MPGKYTAKLTVGSWTGTQPFTVIEDPRVTQAGVTLADLQDQFDHNIRVRDLVSDINKTVGRVRAAISAGRGDQDEAERAGEPLDHTGGPV